MRVLIGIAFWGGIVWWILKGRESSGAILANGLISLLAGGFGVALLVSGSGGGDVLAGLGLLGYAAWGVYQTIPWIRERMNPDGN